MKNRNKIIILLLFILLFFTSCEEINGVLGLLPKFDSTLPNNISGKWVYFENEEDRSGDENEASFTRQFIFDSKENKFSLSYVDKTQVNKSGSYSYSYKTYTITECNGVLTLRFDDGSVEEYDFYISSTAISGPEKLMLSDGLTYYYWGNV